MVNIDWSFSLSELQERYGLEAFRWLNDFQANAHALPHLAADDLEVLRAGQSADGARLATMGPGTGLGGATLEWVDGVPRACDSEPGHTGLSPANELELEIFRLLVPRHGEMYAEFLVSGAGLERLYRALSEIRGNAPELLTAAEVSARGLAGSDAACVQALETFCALLGSACGDFVLSKGAYGGLYLAGGIVPRMLPFLKASSFEQRFRDKGEMGPHLDQIPLYAITTPHPGLLGAAHAPL